MLYIIVFNVDDPNKMELRKQVKPTEKMASYIEESSKKKKRKKNDSKESNTKKKKKDDSEESNTKSIVLYDANELSTMINNQVYSTGFKKSS